MYSNRGGITLRRSLCRSRAFEPTIVSMCAYFPGNETPLPMRVRGLSEDFDLGLASVDLPANHPKPVSDRSASRDFGQRGRLDWISHGSRRNSCASRRACAQTDRTDSRGRHGGPGAGDGTKKVDPAAGDSGPSWRRWHRSTGLRRTNDFRRVRWPGIQCQRKGHRGELRHPVRVRWLEFRRAHIPCSKDGRNVKIRAERQHLQFTNVPTASGLPRSDHDAAGRCLPPNVRPDALAAWRGSRADTAVGRHAAGTGSLAAAALAQHRRGSEVSDREHIADKIRATLPLLLDPIEQVFTVARSASSFLSLILWRKR